MTRSIVELIIRRESKDLAALGKRLIDVGRRRSTGQDSPETFSARDTEGIAGPVARARLTDIPEYGWLMKRSDLTIRRLRQVTTAKGYARRRRSGAVVAEIGATKTQAIY